MTTAVYILRKIALVLSAALTIVVIAALLWMLVFLSKAVAPVRLAVNAAQASSAFRNAVGQPVQTGTFVRGTISPFSGNADLKIPISGDKGEGVLEEWAQQSGKWRLCSLVYRSKDGQTRIVILPDESAPCERE